MGDTCSEVGRHSCGILEDFLSDPWGCVRPRYFYGAPTPSFCRPKISNQILDRAAESLSTLTQNRSSKSYYDCLKGVSKIWKSWAEVFGSRKFKSKKKISNFFVLKYKVRGLII